MAVPETKRKLVDAAIGLMRTCGYNATTVDDICAAAGVTKGGFFHYFKSKDELAMAALTHFREGKAKEYEDAPFQKSTDPLDRVFGRLDYVKKTSGDNQHPTKGCLFGMFAQELAFTSPSFRSACQGYFSKIAEDFGKDLAAAKAGARAPSQFRPKPFSHALCFDCAGIAHDGQGGRLQRGFGGKYRAIPHRSTKLIWTDPNAGNSAG